MGLLLFTAAVLGYTVNYYTGKVLGLKYFNQHSRFFKPEYLTKTNDYFMKHGGKTTLIARFIPFVRSFMGLLLFTAAVLGYTVNYYTGKVLGLKYFNQHSR
ncbi:VTT domain-containing protein, partial [Staphylococcus aureus]|uniref:VTT domain-containing protein n=1 Tax=Staphylococcus aureus TaxID=1280 RepID=UPI000F3E807C